VREVRPVQRWKVLMPDVTEEGMSMVVRPVQRWKVLMPDVAEEGMSMVVKPPQLLKAPSPMGVPFLFFLFPPH